MGLPIFITPVEPEVASKATEKVAAGPRSSIRRQRTLRGPHARMTAESRRRRMLGLVADSDSNTPAGDYEVWESQQRSPPQEPEIPSVASLHARAHRMFENERMRLRDSLSFERQNHPSTGLDGLSMPPVPESRDYSNNDDRHREIERLHQVRRDLRRIARRRPAPTPPYTETDIAFLVRMGSESPRPSSLTPALSPSRRSPPAGEADISRTYAGPPIDDAGSTARRATYAAGQPESSTLLGRVQALRRTSNDIERSRRLLWQARQARLDGLGDRDRSLSPDGVAAWDTLLTSITPDPQPPSAGSSFASTSAVAAAASSSNAGLTSINTSMTSLERTGDSPTLRDCDISDSGSNTEEEEEDDMYELQDFNRMRGDRFWRSYADIVTARADRVAHSSGDTEHLGGMHRIISRLAERDDIPESWWTSVGLRREPTA